MDNLSSPNNIEPKCYRGSLDPMGIMAWSKLSCILRGGSSAEKSRKMLLAIRIRIMSGYQLPVSATRWQHWSQICFETFI
jgi:hypothetical protein